MLKDVGRKTKTLQETLKERMTEKELQSIENRCKNATRGPWKSFVEGRDHTSGASFIMTGEDDIYINRPLSNNQDFIASAKQDIPKLISEIRRLKGLSE